MFIWESLRRVLEIMNRRQRIFNMTRLKICLVPRALRDTVFRIESRSINPFPLLGKRILCNITFLKISLSRAVNNIVICLGKSFRFGCEEGLGPGATTNACGRKRKSFGVVNESESCYVFILDVDSRGKNFRNSGSARNRFEDFMNRSVRSIIGD